MQMFGPNKCCISLQDIEFDLSDKQKKTHNWEKSHLQETISPWGLL